MESITPDMDPKDLQLLTTVLIHVEDFKVDWTEVMKETGISRRDNCATKFKGMIKKYGLEFQKNKFQFIEDHKPDNTVPAGSTPAGSNATKNMTKRRKGGSKYNKHDGERAEDHQRKKAKKEVKTEADRASP